MEKEVGKKLALLEQVSDIANAGKPASPGRLSRTGTRIVIAESP